MFREAFNRVQDTGFNQDFGVTQDSHLYFNFSTPSPDNDFRNTNVKVPKFSN